MVLYYLRLNYCSEPSWFALSPKSLSSVLTRDKLKSPNSTFRALSATCVATISNEADSPLAVRRWTHSWTWTVWRSPITPWRWPRTAKIWLVFIINVDNSSSLSWSIVLAPWFILRPSTFGKRNLPSAIHRSRSGIQIRCIRETMSTEDMKTRNSSTAHRSLTTTYRRVSRRLFPDRKRMFVLFSQGAQKDFLM